MANQLYAKGRERFLTGSIAWLTDDIRVMLVDTGNYTFSSAHEFLSSIAGAARVTSETDSESPLASKTATDGVADAANTTFTSVTGSSVEAIVLFKWTGSDATSPLIAFIDVAVGLPVSPNSGDITIQWDDGPNKIFKL